MIESQGLAEVSYLDLLNSLCPTPASHMKLINGPQSIDRQLQAKAISMPHPEGGRVVNEAAL